MFGFLFINIYHQIRHAFPIGDCWARTGKPPIKSKWVDVKEGDLATLMFRSRFCAKEFAA